MHGRHAHRPRSIRISQIQEVDYALSPCFRCVHIEHTSCEAKIQKKSEIVRFLTENICFLLNFVAQGMVITTKKSNSDFFGKYKSCIFAMKGIVYNTSTIPDDEQQRCLTK